MATLFDLLKNYGYTANGALTNASSGDKFLDLFFIVGTSNEINSKNIFTLIKECDKIDEILTARIMLWARDAREGAGRRQIFKDYLDYISNKPLYSLVAKKVQKLGRIDDLITHKQLQNNIALNIIVDLIISNNTLVFKWLPREKSSKKHLAAKIRKYLEITPKEYRLLLAQKTKVIETNLCNKDYNFDYSKIPSKAMTKYTEAFNRNDKERFSKYKASLSKGNTKINTGALYPHDILKVIKKDSVLADNMWNSYLKDGIEIKEDILPVIDVSGSMGVEIQGSLTALDVAVSLGLYLSEKMEGSFKNHFITFSNIPELVEVKGSNFKEKIINIQKSRWGMNTNLQSVFKLILKKADEATIMPSKILILSDMEFDNAIKDKTNYEVIKQKFKNKNIKMPELVFWNLNGRKGNIPVKKDENGTALISGFSPKILKGVCNNDLNPVKIMLDTVMQERYDV